MLKLIRGGFKCMQTNLIWSNNLSRSQRHFSDDSHLLIGGGLGKLQGGLKEESYFQTQNYDLITKIREQGSKLKCENCLSDWSEFEKVLDTSVLPTALHDTCSLNKHKNCREEAFFMNEQNECSKLMKEKLLNDSINFEYQKRNETSTCTLTFKLEERKKIEEFENNKDISKN